MFSQFVVFSNKVNLQMQEKSTNPVPRASAFHDIDATGHPCLWPRMVAMLVFPAERSAGDSILVGTVGENMGGFMTILGLDGLATHISIKLFVPRNAC